MSGVLARGVWITRGVFRPPFVNVVNYCTKTDVVIAAKEPFRVTLQLNKTYFWCACGRSKKQPFCDSSHRGSNIKPIKFMLEEVTGEDHYLCGCKHTNTPPYCDGTHATELIQEN